MPTEAEGQIELDIAAYVSGQLDVERSFAVMEFLSAHPERAAEVMADLCLTEVLRLSLDRIETPPPLQLGLAADRLEHRLKAFHGLRRWMPLAAAAVMFAFGWAAQSMLSALPFEARAADMAGLFEAALDAEDAVRMRLSLSDEPGPVEQNAGHIFERLGIALPDLPPGWVVRTAQIVATPERPGVAVVIDTPDVGEIMLFSVIRSVDGPDDPAVTATRRGRMLAFFEKDRTAYVLVDNSGPVSDLRQSAEELRHRFN
jgi:anti-sigma factor RsiW